MVVELEPLRQGWIPRAKAAVEGLTSVREAFKTLAELCSDILGDKRAMYDVELTENHIAELQRELGMIAVPLHRLKFGVCRHRALLFKVQCDFHLLFCFSFVLCVYT